VTSTGLENRGSRQGRKLLLALVAVAAYGGLLAASAQAWPVYVVVNEADRIAVIDSATNQLTGSRFETAPTPQRLAITPDGSQLFLSHTSADFVTVVETASGQQLGGPIPVGDAPSGIAITPDGRFAYVADNNGGQVSVIDTRKREVVKTISGFEIPPDVAVAPDGKHAYVAEASRDEVAVIDTATNQVVGSPIPVGHDPNSLAFTPDGRYLFVVNGGDEDVVVIDTALGIVVGSPIPAGELPYSIAITPDGSTAYVTNFAANDVTVIDTASKEVEKTIEVGSLPAGVAVTPDGRSAYVADDGNGEAVSVIDTALNQVATTVQKLGNYPEAVVVAPDQPPSATFAASAVARPGVPVSFSAAGSTDPDGTIASFAWSFGDGTGASGGPTQSHAYAAPGAYPVSLTLADQLGCSTQTVSTGHEASCNGGPGATRQQTITVAYSGVRVACPKRALKKPGCRIKVVAVARGHAKAKGKGRRKPPLTFQSAIAKAKLKPGSSAQLSIVPKPAFNAALETASHTLVREVLDFKTKSGRKHIVKLASKPLS
jgi:YVTN family beta-propeller protein